MPQLGWSKDTICKGAEVVGYPGVIHGMFTRGGGDLIHYFQSSSNFKLVEILKKVCNKCFRFHMNPVQKSKDKLNIYFIVEK